MMRAIACLHNHSNDKGESAMSWKLAEYKQKHRA